jgi:uncharacterized protein (TIGR02594 family)
MNSWLAAYQRRGKALGFYDGLIDGEYGPASERMFSAVFAVAEKAKGIRPPLFPQLDPKYRFLLDLTPLPLIVHEGLKLLGTIETPGPGNSPVIMGWKNELLAAGRDDVKGFTADSIPHCGLGIAIMAFRAGKDISPVPNVLWARDWLKFGVPVDEPMLGDIAVWPRGSGGHVNMVIALDPAGYVHGLGANQSDAVNIMRKHRDQALGFRRPAYRNMPATVRQYIVQPNGQISTREA